MKLPPRSLIKRIIRSHLPSNVRLSKSADLYILLAFQIYLRKLANESRLAYQIDASNGLRTGNAILKRHVNGARKRLYK